MRTFSAGFDAILSGGSCYWMAIIAPNDGSTPMVFGTIPTTTMAGYTIMAGRLIDISDIEQSIDPYKDTFAKTPNVSVEIYNADGAVNQAIMAGSTITIRMGYGATMSIATSEVFFTGKVAEIDRNELHKLKFECTGNLQKFDGEVGLIAADATGDDTGKIYPFTNGEWSDANAYTPMIKLLNKYGFLYAYDLEGATVSWEGGAVYIYDKRGKKGYLFNTHDTNVFFETDGNKIVLATAKDYLIEPLPNCIMNRNIKLKVDVLIYNKIDLQKKAYTVIVGFGSFSQLDSYVVVTKNYTSGYYLNCEALNISPIAHSIGEVFYIIEKEKELTSFAQIYLDMPINGFLGAEETIPNPSSFTKNIRFLTGYNDYPITQFTQFKTQSIAFKFYPICEIPEIEGLKTTYCSITCNGSYNSPTYSSSAKISTISDGGAPVESVDSGITGISEYKTYSMTHEVFSDINGKDIDSALGGLQISIISTSGSNIAARITNKINSLYLSMLVIVDINKTRAWIRERGRKNIDESYWNTPIGETIINPSAIIEDFCAFMVAGMSRSNLDKDSFDAFYSDRADWKLATAIFTGMK